MRKLTIIISLLFNILCFSQSHKKIEVLTVKGNKYFAKNNLDKAEKCFLKIIKIDSFHKDSYFNLGAVHVERNDRENAIHYFKKCVDLGDIEAIEILDTNLNYDFENFNYKKIKNNQVLNKIGLKLLNKDKKEQAEYYFLKSLKNGNRDSYNVLKENYKYKNNDFEFIHYEDADSPVYYIYKTKKYRFNDHNSIGVKKFQQQLKIILEEDKELKKIKTQGRVLVLLRINSSGVFSPSVKSDSKELKAEITRIFVNNFKFIPAQKDGQNIGVLPWLLPIYIGERN